MPTAQNSATVSADMCSWFFNSKLNGSRPRAPGQPKPVTKMPAAMTAISARGDGAGQRPARAGSSAGRPSC